MAVRLDTLGMDHEDWIIEDVTGDSRAVGIQRIGEIN